MANIKKYKIAFEFFFHEFTINEFFMQLSDFENSQKLMPSSDLEDL
jgi:hypothetical protein